jgi:nitrogenase molybdenum-iron protein NifN
MNTAEKINIKECSTNACRLCTPLGSSLVFKGIKGAIPLMHGSQGCSTYIRRYLISHYKEPIDIASSNFTEETAIFGGGANLKQSIANVSSQYEPELIGISTTCLSETIGDDVPLIVQAYKEDHQGEAIPEIVHVSTPSYTGTHADGFIGASCALVDTLAEKTASANREAHINIMPGMLSPADLRYLKEILSDFGISYTMLPDYSATLDAGPWKTYQKISEGGTSVQEIRGMGNAMSSIEFGSITQFQKSAAKLLQDKFEIPAWNIPMPIGVKNTDIFFEILKKASNKPVPEKYRQERKRLLDSYIDAHKYIFGTRAVIYGEEDFVAGMFSFLTEIGVVPVICASGGTSRRLKQVINDLKSEDSEDTTVLEGADFSDIEEAAQTIGADIFIGHSKGYSITRKLNIPIVRVGFPIHDRIGGARILHVGYRGAQELFDKITNAVLETKQEESGVGYSYL